MVCYSKNRQQVCDPIGELADTIYAQSGKVVWYAADPDYQTLACARSVSYLPDMQPRGIVSVSVPQSYLRSLYEELVPADMGQVYLLDETGTVLSSLTGDRLGQLLEQPEGVSLSDAQEDYRVLNREVRKLGYNIPPLVNAYMSLSPTMRMFGTAINDGFGMVEETGILIAVNEILEEKRVRHIESYLREHPEALQLTSGANPVVSKDTEKA